MKRRRSSRDRKSDVVRKTARRLKRLVKNIIPDAEHCHLLVLARKIVMELITGAIWLDIERIAH